VLGVKKEVQISNSFTFLTINNTINMLHRGAKNKMWSGSSSSAGEEEQQQPDKSPLAEQRIKVIDQQLYLLSKKMAVVTLDSVLPAALAPKPELRPFGDSESEHIYETIPEKVDSEPIYSLPYEPNKDDIWVDLVRKRDSSDKEKDSSSAYNTGESCHSTPISHDLKKQNVSAQNNSNFFPRLSKIRLKSSKLKIYNLSRPPRLRPLYSSHRAVQFHAKTASNVSESSHQIVNLRNENN
jgi:hypothetical protein